jgi:hypothetical protein
MYVTGRRIEPQQVNALLSRMRLREFTASQLALCAEKAGVERGECAMRLADRLIQRERKAGNLSRIGRGWRWSPERLSALSAGAPND